MNTIEEALEDIKQGKIVIVVDDEDRENESMVHQLDRLRLQPVFL